jgi:hypothetical protein
VCSNEVIDVILELASAYEPLRGKFLCLSKSKVSLCLFNTPQKVPQQYVSKLKSEQEGYIYIYIYIYSHVIMIVMSVCFPMPSEFLL